MNHTDFINKVAAFMEREGISGFSNGDGEGSFSWSSCDCCDSGLGGDRHTVTGYVAGKGRAAEYEVCTDCLVYEANGDLPEDEQDD